MWTLIKLSQLGSSRYSRHFILIHFSSDTQSDPDFSIVARVEAFIAGWGLDEALKRSEAYLNAGADAILMHSKKSDPSDIEAFVKAWNNQVHFLNYMQGCCHKVF